MNCKNTCSVSHSSWAITFRNRQIFTKLFYCHFYSLGDSGTASSNARPARKSKFSALTVGPVLGLVDCINYHFQTWLGLSSKILKWLTYKSLALALFSTHKT